LGAVKNKKVIARIVGGIGNQLFVYAAARRLALLNDAELVLDTVSGFKYDSKYQRHFQLRHFCLDFREATYRERLEPFSVPRRYFKRLQSRVWGFKNTFITDPKNIFDPSILSFKFSGELFLEGYWQDERYFKDAESVIRKELKFIPPTDELNLSVAESIRSKLSIAIHVRFFFDPDSGENINMNYYNSAIRSMEKKFKNAHYFLFSDKPDEAKRKINLPNHRFTLIGHNFGDENSYADLWLMSLCDHFIIANSTYSWWGAWLSESNVKYVIAPSLETLGSEDAFGNFNRIVLNDWDRV
tara:strand:- start:15315 stop:16211 length:897 start_codon:yes stop_codon:yes gene_type:complete